MSPSTVSKGLGEVLAMAGINTEVFKAHSTQSASSSKAEVTGVSLTDIIKQVIGLRLQPFKAFTEKVSKNMTLIFNQESSTSSFEKSRLE